MSAARDRLERDCAADLLGELDEAGDDRCELVAVDVPDRRIERRRHRRRRERRDLVVGENGREFEERARPLVGIGAVLLPPLELLARGWAWRPDPDRRLATAHAVAQLEPGLESGDPRGRRPLHRDQQLVAERVAVKAGAGGEPRLPTLGAAQPFDGLTGVLAITLATLGALLVGELSSLLDGHPSALLSWGPAGCGADPRPQGARQGATIGRGRPRSR